MLDLEKPVTQEAFGSIVGVSQQAVSELLTRFVLIRDAPVGQWITAYCSHLREQAAGRAGNGDLRLADERARLASEQADRVAMQNARERKELAPTALLTAALAAVSSQLVGILDGIPIKLRRQVGGLTAEALKIIEAEIAAARTAAAKIEIDIEGDVDPGAVLTAHERSTIDA